MKFWAIVLLMCVGKLVVGQAYTDTVKALNISLSVEQEIWLDEANEIQDDWRKKRESLRKRRSKIEELKQEADACQETKRKRKLLRKVLEGETEFSEKETEFLNRTRAYNEAIFKVFEHGLKYAKQPKEQRVIDEVERLREQAVKDLRKGKSKRKKSERVRDVQLRVQEVKEANVTEQNAIGKLIRAIKVANGLITIQDSPKKEPETKAEEPSLNRPEQDSLMSAAVQTDKPIAYQEVNIIYKVQIAADRNELTSQQLRKIYTPTKGMRIHSEMEDGWYKYSIGRFSSYSEAAAFRQQISVPGAFIIAYRDEKKISLPESVKVGYSGERKLDLVDGQEIVYRIQISATKQPATPAKVREMNLAGRIVNITQHDGWFKYTIGNFVTRNEAEQSLKKLPIRGAFVVGYTTSGIEVVID